MTWRPIIVALKALAAAAAALALVGAGVLWRLSDGPLPLGFAAHRAAAALSLPRLGLHAGIDGVDLAWPGWGRPAEVRVRGLRYRDEDGRTVAAFGAVAAELDAAALARRWAAPGGGGAADGGAGGGGAGGGPAAPGPGGPAAVLAALHGALHGADAPVRRLWAEGVAIGDGALGLPRIDIERRAAGPAGSFTVAGGGGTGRGELRLGAAAGSGEVTLDIDGIDIGAVAGRLAGLAGPPRVTVSARASVRLDGGSGALGLALGGGAGEIAAGGAGTVAFTDLAASARIDPAARRLEGGEASLRIAGDRVRLAGVEAALGGAAAVSGRVEADRIPPPLLGLLWPAGTGADRRGWALAHLDGVGAVAVDVALRAGRRGGPVRFDIASGPGGIAAPDARSAPLRFGSIAVGGSYDPAARRLSLDDTTIDFDLARVSVTGAEVALDGDALVTARVETGPMPLAALATFWPPDTAAAARRWVLDNVRDGTIAGASADLAARIGLGPEDMGALALEGVSGRADLEGFTVGYLDPLPPAAGVDATMTFDGDRIGVSVLSGSVDGLDVGGSEVRIRDIGAPRETMSVSAAVRGPVARALAILDHPRLDLLSPLAGGPGAGLEPARVGGEQRARLEISFPLLDALALGDVRASATASVSGLAVPAAFGGRDLVDGEFEIQVGDGVAVAEGTAEVAARPVRLEWVEGLAGDRSRTVTASLGIDGELARELGVAPFLDGPAAARLVWRRDGDGPPVLRAALDIGAAALTVPVLGRVKGPGRPGALDLVFRPGGGGPGELAELAVRAGGLTATAVRTDGLWVVAADSGRTSFTGTLLRDGDGVLSIEGSGAGLDASALVERMRGGGPAARRPFRVQAEFGRLWVGRDWPLSDARITLDHAADGWRRLVLDAALPGGGGAVRGELAAADGGHDLAVDVANAGAALAALGLGDGIEGGGLTVRATRRGGTSEPWRGVARTGAVRVVRAPLLARLLQRMSLSGLLTTFENAGLVFGEVTVPFEFRDPVAAVTGARAVGAELSLTAAGEIDTAEGMLDLSGTVIPAPMINRILANIPIIGPIASGGDDHSVFAADYRATGPVTDPEVLINPLSLLAPGLIRELFGNLLGSLNRGADPPEPEEDP